MTAAVEVRGLAYALPGDGRTLVQNVSFTVGLGETLVLLGRSGSGKTTTLKLINRLLEPTAGEVLVAGERTAALEATRLRRRIGYVIQEVGLFPHFTVAQNVGLVPRLERWPADRMLDEPFGALDPITRVELQREFRGLERRLGKGMVFVTHDVREGLLLGTRIGLMQQGRLVFLGTPDEFRESTEPEAVAFMSAADPGPMARG